MMLKPLLLPLVLLAADGPEVPPPGPPPVSFEIRNATVQGLEWRDALVDRAEQVDWVDGVAFWSIDDATLREVLTTIQGSPRGECIQAPKLVTREGEVASYNDFKSRNLVTSLDRVADGPRFEATAVAFEPRINAVQDGVELGISATRGEANSFVLNVEVCEKRIEAVHMAAFEDGVKGNPETGAQPARLRTQYQVPQVVKVSAEATCHLPSGRNLLVCLGPRTETEKGKIRSREVVYERFLIITPRGTTAAPTTASAQSRSLPTLPSPVGN